jgi:subtilisin family serine protease
VYPAALKGVIDVASTSNSDIRSTFSNYGAPPVWLSAPGEGVMTTYPFSTYAAGWGTSFSAPFVSGTVALMRSMSSVQVSSRIGISSGSFDASVSLQACADAPSWEGQSASALAHAQAISDPEMGNGRLDTYQAMRAWSASLSDEPNPLDY